MVGLQGSRVVPVPLSVATEGPKTVDLELFADAEVFFGRERLVAELVARLVGAPLLGIVGPSGSGKSSVGRALSSRTGWPFVDNDELQVTDRSENCTSRTDGDPQDRIVRGGSWDDVALSARLAWYRRASARRTHAVSAELEGASLAAPADGKGYPVHVYSHGSSGFPATSFRMARYFASHGWLYVAPTHVGNTLGSPEGKDRPFAHQLRKAANLAGGVRRSSGVKARRFDGRRNEIDLEPPAESAAEDEGADAVRRLDRELDALLRHRAEVLVRVRRGELGGVLHLRPQAVEQTTRHGSSILPNQMRGEFSPLAVGDLGNSTEAHQAVNFNFILALNDADD